MVHRSVDVAIVGGGLAGAGLAAVLGRRGVSVAMFDPHENARPDFRAEKLTPAQLAAFERLGLARAVRDRSTPIERLSIVRFGEIVEERQNREVGLDYADLVNAMREQVPPRCRTLARVVKVEASADRQALILADGCRVDARLLVIATGLGKSLLKGLDITRVAIASDHCLAVGFDMTCPGETRRALTTFGSHGDRSAYLTVFPIKDRVRANLFIYRHHDEDWARDFRASPRKTLLDMMPELDKLVPDFSVGSSCVLRPIHLYASEGHIRDGVVLVGDAFATTCPTGGTGVDKALTDVECLAALVPGWLMTPGMSRVKIQQFYENPAKCASDRNAARMTAYARAMALDKGIAWTARRYRNFYAQKMRYWARRHLWINTRGLAGTKPRNEPEAASAKGAATASTRL